MSQPINSALNSDGPAQLSEEEIMRAIEALEAKHFGDLTINQPKVEIIQPPKFLLVFNGINHRGGIKINGMTFFQFIFFNDAIAKICTETDQKKQIW